MAGAEPDIAALREAREAVDPTSRCWSTQAPRSSNIEAFLETSPTACIVGSDFKVDGYTWNPVDRGARHGRGRSAGPARRVSLLLGIDIGTTGDQGDAPRPRARAGRRGGAARALHSAHPGWAEEDVDQWWSNVCALCHELLDGREIAGVGVSGMVPCVILLDEHGRPLRRSIQQNDARAGAEIEELRSRLAGARTSWSAPARRSRSSPSGPALMWLAAPRTGGVVADADRRRLVRHHRPHAHRRALGGGELGARERASRTSNGRMGRRHLQRLRRRRTAPAGAPTRRGRRAR